MTRSFADHFSGVAEGYASYRPQYPPSLFAYLAGLTSGRALAWDCAAGSGQATMSLLPYFDRIVAYAEVRRVLVPDGIIAMWSYGLHRISDREIDNAIAFPWWGDEQCQRRVTWPLALRVGSVR